MKFLLLHAEGSEGVVRRHFHKLHVFAAERAGNRDPARLLRRRYRFLFECLQALLQCIDARRQPAQRFPNRNLVEDFQNV